MLAWTRFNLWSLMNLMMSLAASVGMPCCSVTTLLTVSLAARSISPDVRFLVGTPRRTRRPCRISHSAFILKSSSAMSVSVFSSRFRSMDARDPLKSYRCATSFRAWLTALSTSWMSTPDVLSKETGWAMPASGRLADGALRNGRLLLLRLPPEVHAGDAVDAAHRAERRAPLRGEELATDVLERVAGPRH